MKSPYGFEADRGDDGRRLDHVLVRRLAHYPDLSRTLLGSWIDEGRVQVQGEVEKRGSRKIRHRDRIEVALPQIWGDRPLVEAEPVAVQVLWEDESLLAVAKPPGLVVHPTWGHQTGTLLNGLLWLARDWPEGQRPHLVNRLDQDTSGLLLVAKSSRVAGICGRAFEKRKPVKRYLALVRGRSPVRKERIAGALARDESQAGRWRVTEDGGLPSVTEYELLAESPGRELSLLACRLLTGRTHQIRVHLASRGLPIVGDPVYGAARGSELRNAELEALCRAFPRQALHSWELKLAHPVSGDRLELRAPVPDDFADLLEAAGFDRR
jgi:23S rRNA pseudouridine1911/1915/1917 synthase